MNDTIDPSRLGLILIDAQPAFLDDMHGPTEPVLTRLEHLQLLAREFEIPSIATFEHPVEEKGWFPERLERVFPESGQRYIKRTYDLTREPDILHAVDGLGRDQLIVAGAETDVCVLQSVMGLLKRDYTVFLVQDCLFSAECNVGPALRRMERAGAIPTTYKTLYYELKVTVDVPAFHECWNRERGHGEQPYVSPYDLPPIDPNS